MESQPQNPKFRNNPENFHSCTCPCNNQIPYLNVFKFHILKSCCYYRIFTFSKQVFNES